MAVLFPVSVNSNRKGNTMRYLIFAQMTIAQTQQLKTNGLPENYGQDHFPVVKFFMPGTGCTWLLTDIDPEDDNIAFGLCDLGMGFLELGYVDLDELGSVKNRFGLRVERDISFKGKYPISVYADAAREVQQITEDDAILAEHAEKHQPTLKPE